MSKRTARPVAVISSTAREMPDQLRVALDVCLRLRMIPVMVEHPAAGTLDAVEASLSMVDNADIYIGIFGERYGYVPVGYEISIGEMEYNRASERGIPRLVFTSGLRFPPDAAAFETTHELVRLKAFLNRLRQQQSVSEAESAQEFRTLLIAGLTAFGIRREARKTESKPRKLDALERKKGGADGDAKSARRKVTPAKKQRDVFRLFVASPRDVQDERSRMPKVVESLNRTLGKLLNVVIELWRWEADAPPGVGEPQALIDPELDDADVVLVIFWNRFGTPASNGVTGTQGEVLRSLKRWSKSRRPQVMIYFCQRPARLERTELEQRLKLLDFRERISSLVLAVDYEEAQEFEWRVRDDLFLTISGLVVKPR